MKKLLFLLLLASFSLQLTAMDERPSKRQKHSEEPSDLSFFDELPDIADLEDINSENKENNENNQIMSNDLDQEPEPTLTDKYHQQCVQKSIEYFSNFDEKETDLELNIMDQQLYDAVTNDDEKAVKEALDKGANPNINVTYAHFGDVGLIFVATFRKNVEIVSLLLSRPDHPIDISDMNASLDCSVSDHRWDIADLLISYGADVNNIRYDYHQYTPLISCISGASDQFDDYNDEELDQENVQKEIKEFLNDYLETARLLIKNGADINAQNEEGQTALMVTISEEFRPIIFKNSTLIQYLIDNGALISIKNNKGETALDIAKSLENKKVVELLEDKLTKNIKTFQKKLSEKISETTPLINVLASLTSEYLEGEY